MLTEPLSGSPRVGDEVVVRTDVLAEIGREVAGVLPTWCFVPAGTPGRLIGWRDRGDDHKAIVDVHGTPRRVVLLVCEDNVTTQKATRADASRLQIAPRSRTASTCGAASALPSTGCRFTDDR